MSDFVQNNAEEYRHKRHGKIGHTDGKRRIEHRIDLPRSAADRKDKEAPGKQADGGIFPAYN